MSKPSLVQKLGIKYPIIQSPMAGVSTIEMASSVTNKGGLGSIPLSTLNFLESESIDKLKEMIAKYRSQLNDKSLYHVMNLNLFCHDIVEEPNEKQFENWKNLYKKTLSQYGHDFDKVINDINFQNGNISFKEIEKNENSINKLIDLLIEIKPKVISFHFGFPSRKTIAKLQKNGIMIFVTATSVAEVNELYYWHEKWPFKRSPYEINLIDGIILQGSEAGGHRGNFLDPDSQDEYLSTKSLFIKSKNYLDYTLGIDEIPFLIPTGGIMDSSSISWYLNNEADAVQLGTIFLATPESTTSSYFSNLHYPLSQETIMTKLISGKQARCIKTTFIRNIIKNYEESKEDLPPYGWSYFGYKSLLAKLYYYITHVTFDEGEDIRFNLCGSNHFLIDDSLTTNEIMDKLIRGLIIDEDEKIINLKKRKI
ncbi:uncharacterized protein KGF55_005091 [Candida pseudojiufengensis]|uniref:uncharacterized protein n=1 Tax=Candida pseudojiufengensis TaxID=497109 RepID=UPI002224211E|nr:uncharacterized protein KGF55_005091 [Candida pseudojiufengensis]KAI5959859.1 hypothetical protein KGF55_005091 [Candida pseudojiufengensis]